MSTFKEKIINILSELLQTGLTTKYHSKQYKKGCIDTLRHVIDIIERTANNNLLGPLYVKQIKELKNFIIYMDIFGNITYRRKDLTELRTGKIKRKNNQYIIEDD